MSRANWAVSSGDELHENLLSKIKNYDEYLVNNGYISRLRDSYNAFYGDTQINEWDNQQTMTINHYASLIRSLNSLITNQRISFLATATNTDVASQQACILSNALLEFYLKDKKLDRVFKNAALMASYLYESWIETVWDTQVGSIIHPGNPELNEAPIKEGDLSFKLYNMTDVIRDYSRNDNNHQWLITRNYVNRYDLISQFPEYEDEILGIEINKNELNRIRLNNVKYNKEDDSDLIPFYTFYHDQSSSLPNGRLVNFIDGALLTDSALPYPEIPLVMLAHEDSFGECFGHSPICDILPLQTAINSISSSILSNNVAFGTQSIVVEKGSDVSVSQVSGGLNFIEVNQGSRPPSPLQLTMSSPESYKFLDFLISNSQLLSGINSTVRGESNNLSGAAMALLSNQALMSINGLQQSYTSMIERVGSLSISILQLYANTKRIAQLAGKHSRPMLTEWSSQDLNGVAKVTIETGSALSKSLSGRLEIAKDLMGNGFIKSPEQYLMVLETGRLEPLYENESRELQLIRSENEKLSNGEAVRALITDSHELHVREHASVLSSPEVRSQPDSPIVQNTLAHIQEHLELARSIDPALSMILKQQPLPPPQAQAPPQDVMNNVNPIETQAGDVNGPSMPRDLINGGKFNPPQQ